MKKCLRCGKIHEDDIKKCDVCSYPFPLYEQIKVKKETYESTGRRIKQDYSRKESGSLRITFKEVQLYLSFHFAYEKQVSLNRHRSKQLESISLRGKPVPAFQRTLW